MQVAASYSKGLVECDVSASSVSAGTQGTEHSRYQQRRDEMLHYNHYIVSRQRVHGDRACRRLLDACPEYLTSMRGGAGYGEGLPLFSNAEIRRAGGLAMCSYVCV